ncbi:hypothetical protein N7G274_003841 [Stereocaulon virgatum]|uniref:Uncharacterized protein n=1 Tax=Stereocaulon virgatum TaxID=373712 RepID=A0ABR4AFP9_9LECA
MELATAKWCTSSDCPIGHIQHNKGIYLHDDNPPPDDLQYPKFGQGNPPPSIWAARRRIIDDECTDDDLAVVAAFNYYHGHAQKIRVSKQYKRAGQGLKRQVSFDLGRNVAFEAPEFEELAVSTTRIRARGKRPILKLRLREQTDEERRIEKRRIEEEWLEAQGTEERMLEERVLGEQMLEEQRLQAQQADDRFDEQRGDPAMKLLSLDALRTIAVECGAVLDAMDVDEDVSDLELGSAISS